MTCPRILAIAALGLAAPALAGAPKTSAQASESSVEEEIEQERARLHKNVQQAVPASHEKSTVNMWKTARPSAAKVQAAAAVAAGDWADADGAPVERGAGATKSSPYGSNADAVEQERSAMQKGAQRAAGGAEKTGATKWKTAKPDAAKVKEATKVASGDWANAEDVKQATRPAVEKVQAAKEATEKKPNLPKATKPAVEKVQAPKEATGKKPNIPKEEKEATEKKPNVANEAKQPNTAERADKTVQVAKAAAKKAAATAAVSDSQKGSRQVIFRNAPAKKAAASLRKRGKH